MQSRERSSINLRRYDRNVHIWGTLRIEQLQSLRISTVTANIYNRCNFLLSKRFIVEQIAKVFSEKSNDKKVFLFNSFRRALPRVLLLH